MSDPAVRPPVSALPPGPLRIEATFTASVAQPLHQAADQVRSALLNVAAERLGLITVAVDLRVTDLHEGTETDVGSRTAEKTTRSPSESAPARNSTPTGTEPLRGPIGELDGVVSAVPGVARLTAALGGHPIRVEQQDDPPGRHIEVQLAVAPGHHPLEVARAVRAAVTGAAARDTDDPVTVAVLVTETAA
ncbi:hypothetical protein ABZY19_21680 [Streptomyces sp. NPDC006475]|uniref:hypothetical protein n=1 Tax=Streptomyces sp. NPDC006475 TaxID=3155719 RepID=UPI0033B7AE06